jgi:hypothetical protein
MADPMKFDWDQVAKTGVVSQCGKYRCIWCGRRDHEGPCGAECCRDRFHNTAKSQLVSDTSQNV